MKYVFITAILDLNITEVIKNPIKVSDGILLTNNSNHFKKYIDREKASAIGTLEINCMLGGNPVLFLEKDVQNLEMAKEEIINFMRGGLAFLTALWAEVDNSANFELAFAISQEDRYVHSNSLTNHFWTCTGEKGVLNITQSELEGIAERSLIDFGAVKRSNELEHTLQRKEFGRINMAGNFLLQARGTSDLGMKIANYCSFFEAMLSSNNVELSHQMAERSAFYLCETPQERLEHYRKSKRAYGVRSKIVHGDVVSKGQLKEIREIAIHCDRAARGIFRKSLEDDEYRRVLQQGESEELDNFMLNKLFGI